jgi:hypothetical protein
LSPLSSACFCIRNRRSYVALVLVPARKELQSWLLDNQEFLDRVHRVRAKYEWRGLVG